MIPEADRIMISQDEIAAKVQELGSRISQDYGGEEILVVGILKGAAIFMSDLVRSIASPVAFDFMAVSSYGASTESSGIVRIIKDLDQSIEGRHVLIVEDVVDTGLTLNYLVENLRSRNPASLKLCSLLDKPSRRKVEVKADYTGFEIPDEFVVGYGLDYSERFRNLPYIAVLKKDVYIK
ncbi:MAG: hypoxanthine phosphoribosyltransferase [Clostridia bacterium]|nr:hypoxanthine phosphoribosyltransferase [Clostridia bacterium]